MSRPSKLTDAQKRYLLRAVTLRRKLTNAALARRLNVCISTITTWANPDGPYRIKMLRITGPAQKREAI